MSNETVSTVLHCKQLEKSYRDGRQTIQVLQQIDFTVRTAETIAIVGASGCGKSTLLHLLGGLDRPTGGEVYWGEQAVNTMTESQRCKLRNRHVGFVYQFHHLLPEFTALENVMIPQLIGNVSPAKARVAAVERLTQVGLAKRQQHKVTTLSGGERQRVALARALVIKPAVLLADEPSGNLDSQTAKQMLAVMFELQQACHTALVMVTHDLALAEQLQHYYRLTGGHLIEQK